MLKLIKYEFRKNLYGTAVMGGIILAAQLYFMYASLIADNRNKALGGSWFLVITAVVCFFMVFATGVVTYSKELSNKTGYLVFMTPNSAIKIIGSKLLYTFFNGVIVLAVLVVLGITDWKILAGMWEQELSVFEIAADMLSILGVDVAHILYSLLAVIVKFLINFFMAVTLAYMSVTATATVLQNKKVKGLISVVLYIVMLVGIGRIGEQLPRIYEYPESFTQVVLSDLPCTLFFLIIIVGAVTATAGLLEKHVSL